MNMPVLKTEAVDRGATSRRPPRWCGSARRKPSFVKATLLPMLGAIAARVVPPLVMLALLLAVWQILCMQPGATLPSPTKIWTEAYDLIVDPFFVAGPQDIGLGWRVLTSLQRVAIGYGLAGLIGIMLGTIIGQSVWAMRGLDPIFQMLRTISPLAWLPISLAAFRDSQPSAIFVIFITAVWPIIINTAVGIRNIPQDYRNVAAVLRLNHLEFFCKIMIPSAAPYIFTGLRIGIGLSWLAIVAAEMLTGGVGIGFFIWDAWNSSRLSDIVVALVYIGVVGFVLDRIVAGIATIVTRGTSRQLKERSMTPYLKIDHVDKILHARLARDRGAASDITLTIEQGEYVSIIGHSGCGKITLLNIVAGLMPVTQRGGAAGEPGGQRARPRPRRRVPEPFAAAVAHRLRQRPARRGQGVRRPSAARRARMNGRCTISSSCRWRTPRTSGRRKSPAA